MKPELKKSAKTCSKKIVCEENHRKFTFHTNNFEVYKIKIDGDVKKDTEDIEIFIELKGSDIKKAYKQIITSYKKYSDKSKNPKLYAAIVTSKYPARDSSIQNKQKELAEIFERVPFIKNNCLEVKYNSEYNIIEKAN